jgi:arylsulfatase A-like enzyme
VDFCASFAALTGQKLGPDDAPDSFNVLPALLGESPTGRAHLLEYSGRVAIRQGQWKYIPGTEGDGGKKAGAKRGPQDDALYDLAKDPGELDSVAGQHPEVVEKLSRELARLRGQGRSRP